MGPGPFRRPRLYQLLAEHLSDFIEAQGLSPGDKLPPERALAAQLGVSRATLSQALVALEVQGRVDIRHGDGVVVQRSCSVDEHAVRSLQSGLVRSAAERLGVDEALPEAPDALWARLCALADEPGTEQLLDRLDAGAPPPLTATAWKTLRTALSQGRIDEACQTVWDS